MMPEMKYDPMGFIELLRVRKTDLHVCRVRVPREDIMKLILVLNFVEDVVALTFK